MSFGILEIATSGLITGLTKAVMKGSRKIKIFFVIAVLFGIIGIALTLSVEAGIIHRFFNVFAGISGIISVLIILGIYAYQTTLEENEAKAKLKKVEDRVLEHPNEPTAAWELARIKLESYLNRNLVQIRWIFIWTVLIMIIGFIIIGYGIMKAYESEKNTNATLITTIVGLIIEFIGATFLIIYKSTMAQAKDFVNVLERINAVGMSVQIVDRIEEDQKLKNQTGAEIAKLLLDLYGIKSIKDFKT